MKRLASVVLSLGLAVASCSSADTPTSETGGAPTAAPTTSAVESSAAPTSDAASTTTTAPPTTAVARTTTTPATTAPQRNSADAGDDAGRETQADTVDPLDAAVTAWMERTGAPGVVLAITQGGAEPTTFAWGVSDIATDTPMTVEHHVRIGSVTKSVTAAVILQLVAEGLVALDAPVAQYLGDGWAPGYEHAAAVTVRDLLGHTSGFVEYAFDLQFYQLAAPRLTEPISPEEILEFASKYGAVSELGTEHNYNTTGYVAAGLLIEAVTGNSAAAEIRSRVFEPLGLQHIFLTPEEFPPEPIANGYVGGTISYIMGPLLGLTNDNRIDHNGNNFVDIGTVPSVFARSAGWTGGGLESQIGDVALLIRGLFATDILDADQIAEMTAGHPDPSDDYGLGISTGEILGLTVHSHGGGVPGFRTFAGYVPQLDLGVALTANLLGIDAGDDVEALLQSIGPLLAAVG